MGTITNTVNANQGNLDQLSHSISGFLPGLGQQAFGANPGLGAANQYAMNSMNGNYLNGNQYLEGMIGQTANDVSGRVNNMFAKSGASLGTQHAGAMTRELANAENSMRYGNYNAERQLQQGAAGMMPQLNAAQYAGVMPYLAAAQTAGGMPYTGISNLGQLGSLAGGYGTQTAPGQGWGAGLLGAAASLGSAAILASARELKTDIEELGDWDDRGDGLKRYRFRYKSDPTKTMLEGVMADEVKLLRPKAYVPNFVGDKPGVNYALLSEAA